MSEDDNSIDHFRRLIGAAADRIEPGTPRWIEETGFSVDHFLLVGMANWPADVDRRKER